MADPRLNKQTYRSPATQQAYVEYTEAGGLDGPCPLCHDIKNRVVKEFEHWRIVTNRFPYDAITDTHHMIITKDHLTEPDLTREHKYELYELKQTYLNEQYTFIMEALPKNKSIPPHHHLHLIVVKTL